MSFDSDVALLLFNYQGLTLKSISGTANITINNINLEEEIITISCSDGKIFNESFKRMRIVYNALLENRCTHVEAALQNSGSRRNVPETLLANLPFIEYGYINNRKHLFLSENNTHHLGTLKKKG
ncbi:hypothetical protein [Marinomonas sp. TW1]|uniref:hypothetical protein n=1 Tax=Marinomonas sp. TW1 TaxID=1561203 RepID=UPI0007AFAF4A|nr:hypothetical protein [Marinomonas sp. TW1]KZN13939.1 hypothetical protein OA79_07550 [Marinomonas sp. TW1]